MKVLRFAMICGKFYEVQDAIKFANLTCDLPAKYRIFDKIDIEAKDCCKIKGLKCEVDIYINIIYDAEKNIVVHEIFLDIKITGTIAKVAAWEFEFMRNKQQIYYSCLLNIKALWDIKGVYHWLRKDIVGKIKGPRYYNI